MDIQSSPGGEGEAEQNCEHHPKRATKPISPHSLSVAVRQPHARVAYSSCVARYSRSFASLLGLDRSSQTIINRLFLSNSRREATPPPPSPPPGGGKATADIQSSPGGEGEAEQNLEYHPKRATKPISPHSPSVILQTETPRACRLQNATSLPEGGIYQPPSGRGEGDRRYTMIAGGRRRI